MWQINITDCYLVLYKRIKVGKLQFSRMKTIKGLKLEKRNKDMAQ